MRTSEQESVGVNDYLAMHQDKVLPWSQPGCFDLTQPDDAAELKYLFASGKAESYLDNTETYANDLFEIEHPDKKQDPASRQQYVQDILSQGVLWGKFWYMPWDKTVRRYPDKDVHRLIYTSANQRLVLGSEQDTLFDSTGLQAGLSVGMSSLKQVALGGIHGRVILADPDVISGSNLNRVDAGYTALGESKVSVAAKAVSDRDPYTEQTHLYDGVSQADLNRLEGQKVDMIYDAVDSLVMKAALRLFAKKQRVPLIMATDLDRTSILDVERYDLDPDTQPFGGRISLDVIERLANGEVAPQDIPGLTVQIVGPENISPRLMESFQLAMMQKLPRWPQLGTAAAKGGAYTADAARDILLGNDVPSGRTIH